jgi:TetR/AcrR family fatty acid metabolism transcriptional regulator
MSTKSLTRERILEAAEIVFAERGYHDAAVDEIVRRTDMSKGGFYFHFPSKERLFFTIMDNLAERLLNRLEERIAREESALAKVEAALDTALESLIKRRRLAKLLLVQGYSMGKNFEKKRMEIFSRFAAVIKRNLDLAVEEGVIPPIDTSIVAYSWLGAINEVVIRWLYTGKPSPMKETLLTLRGLLLRGVGAQADAGDMDTQGGRSLS